jgi:hypothetical protein
VKVYTRRGDSGETDLFGGQRVAKDDARVEAYGEVDELNASIGVALAAGVQDDVAALGVTPSRVRSTRCVASCFRAALPRPRRFTWPAPCAGGPSAGWWRWVAWNRSMRSRCAT